jgi:YggT family protein
VLYWIRRRLPVVFGGIDLAPVIVLLAILFLEHFVVASLFELAAGMR